MRVSAASYRATEQDTVLEVNAGGAFYLHIIQLFMCACSDDRTCLDHASHATKYEYGNKVRARSCRDGASLIAEGERVARRMQANQMAGILGVGMSSAGSYGLRAREDGGCLICSRSIS